MNRKTLADKLAVLHQDYLQAKDIITTAEDTLASLATESTSLTATVSQLEIERRSLLREVTSLELDLAELRGALAKEQERQEQAARSGEAISAELETCQQTLRTLQPQLEEATTAAAQANEQMASLQAEIDIQRNLRRWQQQGITPEEQAHTRANELAVLQEEAQAKQAVVSTAKAQVNQVEDDIRILQETLQNTTQKKEEMNHRQQALREQLGEVRSALEMITSDRKRLWRQNEEVSGELEREEAALQKENGDLNRLVGE